MVEEKMLVTTCPSCSAKYRVSLDLIGKAVNCEKCGNRFEVTRQDTARQYPTIGKLALKYNFISEKQLEEALSIQKEEEKSGHKTPLEDILIQKGFVSSDRISLLHAAKEFWETGQLDKKFGAIVVKNGFVTQEDIDMAVKEQAREFKETKAIRLVGDILVEAGVLTAEQRDSILTEQQRLTPKTPDFPDVGSVPAPIAGGLAEKDHLFDLTVSEDGITAHILPKADVPESVTIEDIKALLKEKGITYGITDDASINGFLKFEAVQKKTFKIAKGKHPVPGVDASIKYYFDTDPRKVGTVKLGGHIDFRDRGGIPHVKAGALLAEKIPIKKGEPGIDVYGKPVPVAEAKDVKLRCSNGTELSECGLKINAKTDGQPILSLGGKVSVFSELNIRGDVGLETGHIDFNGNVNVVGTVQDKFRVKCGNLTAKEILGAEIVTTGDIKVGGGIIGANINTEGEVRAKYIKGANIYAFGDVIVEKEIVDSKVETSGACRVNTGKILSSVISAKKGIVSVDIGTEVSNPCKLKVGVDHHIQGVLEKISSQIADNEKELDALKTSEQKIEKKQEELHQKIAVLAQVQDRSGIQMRSLQGKKEELQKSNGSPEQLAKVEAVIEELATKAKNAEAAIGKLFEEQDQLSEKIDDIQKKIKDIHDEIQDFNDEKEGVIEWSRKEKSVPVVKVVGAIYEGTTVFGMHSSAVLKKTFRNVSVREVKITDPESGHDWEMKVFSQR